MHILEKLNSYKHYYEKLQCPDILVLPPSFPLPRHNSFCCSLGIYFHISTTNLDFQCWELPIEFSLWKIRVSTSLTHLHNFPLLGPQ